LGHRHRWFHFQTPIQDGGFLPASLSRPGLRPGEEFHLPAFGDARKVGLSGRSVPHTPGRALEEGKERDGAALITPPRLYPAFDIGRQFVVPTTGDDDEVGYRGIFGRHLTKLRDTQHIKFPHLAGDLPLVAEIRDQKITGPFGLFA
jgi:hypothetical protein